MFIATCALVQLFLLRRDVGGIPKCPAQGSQFLLEGLELKRKTASLLWGPRICLMPRYFIEEQKKPHDLAPRKVVSWKLAESGTYPAGAFPFLPQRYLTIDGFCFFYIPNTKCGKSVYILLLFLDLFFSSSALSSLHLTSSQFMHSTTLERTSLPPRSTRKTHHSQFPTHFRNPSQ